MKSPGRSVMFLAKHLDSGGVTTHMMTLAKGLQAKGWRVSLVSGGTYGHHSHTPEWFESEGIRHYTLAFVKESVARTLFSFPVSLYRFTRIVQKERPDLLHVHWRSTSLYAQFVDMMLGIPFVSTLHLNNIPSGPIIGRLSFWGRRAIAISSETRDYLKSAFGVDDSRIETIYLGADATRFRIPEQWEREAARKQFHLRHDLPVVSLVGRLEAGKGHEIALKALTELRKRNIEVQMVFAGAGELRKALEDVVRQWGLEQLVHFVGYVDTQQVYWASDVCILPSANEGFPMTVVESMLSGVPVIRTVASGARDQIEDGVSGFLIPFNDATALADRLEILVTRPDLRARMAVAAKQRADALFTDRVMIDRTLEVYEKVLRGG